MDSQGTSMAQAGITLTVACNNPQAGAQITINLAPVDRPVSWSTGNSGGSTGISLLSSGSGPIPVTSFTITSQTITFLLAPGDSSTPVTFILHAFLVAATGIHEFELSLLSDSSNSVSAALDSSPTHALGSSGTLFNWPSQPS